MSSDWIVASAPVFGLASNVVVQIAAAHLSRRVGVSIISGILAGFAVTILSTASSAARTNSAADTASTWIVVLLTYVALAFGYWAFVNLNITSLRIRILREILHAGAGISRQQLTAEYSAEEFLRRRLERLRNGGQISFRDERWRLESRTLPALAQVLGVIRAVVLPARGRRSD